MKNSLITILLSFLVMMELKSPVQAQMATKEEALIIANNWINLIIHRKGDWGGNEIAEAGYIQEFTRRERVIGYFCHVIPTGFIVISLRKELAPVKAYSPDSDLDPEIDEGMMDLIKGGMERVLNWIEQQVGPIDSARTEDLENILEINYLQAWNELESGAVEINYQEGDVLLTSAWHQRDPYNALCPAGNTGCTNCCPDCTYICPPVFPTAVGCVATAGSQIMKYWAWPPYGIDDRSYNWNGDNTCGGNVGGGTLGATFSDAYDWPRIVDQYVWDPWQNRWEDENGNPLTQAHLDAVAELCYEVGVAVKMDYGVCGSGAYISDMEDAYENYYRYSTACVRRKRSNYTAVNWFNRMKAQFNTNCPVNYIIPGHSIVGDGWQEIGGTPIRQYHMNYGWGNTNYNAWYTLDALYGGKPDDESMLESIYPAQALGSSLSGTYIQESFPYRYFDQDATSSSATFNSGHYLQLLPGITATCTSTTGGSIRFYGSSSNNTRLFTRGDVSSGIRIHNGCVKLNQNGSIKIY